MRKYLTKAQSDRIAFWDDERSIGNSIIVTLHYGWTFDNQAGTAESGEHVRGFDTVKEAQAAVRDAERCTCGECREKGFA